MCFPLYFLLYLHSLYFLSHVFSSYLGSFLYLTMSSRQIFAGFSSLSPPVRIFISSATCFRRSRSCIKSYGQNLTNSTFIHRLFTQRGSPIPLAKCFVSQAGIVYTSNQFISCRDVFWSFIVKIAIT